MQILKEKVEFGKTLGRATISNNDDRQFPVDIVESRKTIRGMDDDF
jgi:hypothetical protein